MTPADLKAEALAQVEQLRRERDEAVRRLNVTVERWGATERERDKARAELERLRGAVEELRNAFIRDADVAERQREACAFTVEKNVDDLMLRKGLAEDVRDTKLVTEGDK